MPFPLRSESQAEKLSCGDSAKSKMSSKVEELLQRFLSACKAAAIAPGDAAGEDKEEGIRDALQQLRRHVLFHGLRNESSDEVRSASGMTTRGRVWKAFIGVSEVSADQYLALVQRGKSPQYEKIRGDSFRTFPQEQFFHHVVPENSIIRVLNSFVLDNDPEQFRYLQGLNAISGPFLFTMPEVDAYFALSRFTKALTPTYWRPEMLGARAGVELLDRCLQTVDKELFDYLRGKSLHGSVYGFPAISSFCSCIPPFEQLLELWDFLFAFGLHLNVMCVVAQLVEHREELLAHPSPNTMLNYRKWWPLNAKKTVAVTMELLLLLPNDLRDRLLNHTVDFELCKEMLNIP